MNGKHQLCATLHLCFLNSVASTSYFPHLYYQNMSLLSLNLDWWLYPCIDLWLIHSQKLSSLNLKLLIFNAIECNKEERFSVDFRKNDKVRKWSGVLEIDWHADGNSFFSATFWWFLLITCRRLRCPTKLISMGRKHCLSTHLMPQNFRRSSSDSLW